MINSITALRHQNNAVNMLRMHPEVPYVLLVGGYGCGKLVPDNTLVQTPFGPKRIDEISIGDKVCGWHGYNTVLDITTEDNPELYELAFSDHTSVTCCRDHLWYVRDSKASNSRRHQWLVKSTAELLAGEPNQYRIPICEPVEYSKKDLPIAPYTLGALIGDGHIDLKAHQYWITTMDPEIIRHIEQDGYQVNFASNNGSRANTYIVKLPRDKIPFEIATLSYHKSIPSDYLYSSIGDRIELLRGLIDTDGYVDMKGTCPVLMYCTVSPQLVKDITQLVESLGGIISFVDKRAGKYTDETGATHLCSERYALRLRLPLIIEKESCTLPRKLNRLLTHNAYRSQPIERKIVSVRPVSSRPGRCLSTDGDNSYLLHDYIVTHNSFTDVIVLLTLISEYMYVEEPINIGVLGVTIKLLRRTVIADLLRYMDLCGMTYYHNSQAGYIQSGNVTLTYLQMQNPDDIYAFNFNCALIDELDELDPEKVPAVMKAIQERCRKMMPASRHFPRRSSFVFFSTTAQGLGGTYHLVRSFDKANNEARGRGEPIPLPYAIIRAKTEDNPHNDPEQIKRLRALYTPEEAAAYLDGKFMNLTTGRVWYSFDRSKHVCMRFPVQPTERIYVGQDFNLGINASAEFIVRNGIIYEVGSHHWNDMGDAAIKLRQLYPTNPITLIPDVSGKEIMQGFVEEFNKASIEIFWNSINPSITERVMAGNILFRTGKLLIMQDDGQHGDMDNAIMCLETHDIDEKTGKPRKGVGIKSPDHHSDSFSYGIWRIIHHIQGYDHILEALKGVHHRDYEA